LRLIQGRLFQGEIRVHRFFLLVILCNIFFVFIAKAQEQSDLDSIQQQIKNKQAQINRQLETARKLQDNLKVVEVQIAKSAKKLNKTEISLTNNQQQLRVLRKQQKGFLASLEQQKSVLAKQIRSAYMTGNYDFAKMLLNQQDAANFERTITYYQYLNKARKSQIDSFNVLVKNLQKVNAKLIDNQSELEQLKGKQLEQQQDVTLSGLSALKGGLLMPAKGNLRKMFGRFRQGQIKWKGVVINGTAGDAVIAIHHAKVIYSDWLRGFGLVTVLDHGDGFMSLYGHNQALLKQAGESVRAGEAVALLGQSGGQSRPNLYFEIRHKGKPINPVNWLKL